MTFVELAFAVSGLLVLPFWALMIAAPGWRGTLALMRSPLVVAAPILLYAALVLPALGTVLPVVARPELGPVAALLGSPVGATAGWVHFLAFDLFVGRWMFLEARERGLSWRWTSPLLLLTLLLGPLGLGAYLLVRSSARQRLAGWLTGLAGGNRPLALLGVASALVLPVIGVLALVDARQLHGASVWLKPAKFAASFATAGLTLAWILGQLADRRGLRRAAWIIAATATIELVLIIAQAARGVPSHFNNRSLGDLVVYQVMGIAITIFWLALAYITVRAFRQAFSDRAVGWGIRMGLLAALLGSAQGFAMSAPTAQQRADLAAGRAVPAIGAHAVGVADGGAGMPITRWSSEGGDLRVAHFVGLHGLQILPLFALGVARVARRRRRAEAGRSAAAARVVIVGAGAYFALMAATLVQALAGRPLGSALGGAQALASAALPALAVGAALFVTAAFAALAARERPGLAVQGPAPQPPRQMAA